MKKLILLFLLLPFIGIAQVSTGQEQDFDYGIRNNAAQTVTTPAFICTQGVDNTIGKIAGALLEKTANKQNALTYDGTGVKYSTVDAVNNLALEIAEVATKTGLLNKNDTFNLIPLTNTTLRIAPVTAAMFWNELFVTNATASNAIKSFAQLDYPLTQLVTATGGNSNANPLTTDGKYVRYIGYDKNGNVYSALNSFVTNNDILQLGFVTVLKSGASVTFLDGTAGPRNVFPQPNIAANTDFDKVSATLTNITIAGNTGAASFSTSNGTITGISVNWKSASNPTNSDPIDVFNYTGQSVAAFRSINDLFLTGTAALGTHTLWTELEDGIAINNKFYNTTTSASGTMANGSASLKRVMVGVRGSIYVQDAEFATTACYPDLATAKSNIYSFHFNDAIVPPGVAFEIARIAYVKGATNFTDASQFYIVNTAGSAGGSSTIPPVSDATTVSKGIIKLAGDFDSTSTADVPVIKSASASQNGLITTGNQSLAGEKTITVTSSGNALLAQNAGTGVALKGISQSGVSGQFLSTSSINPTVYAVNFSSGNLYSGNNSGGEVYKVDNSGNVTANSINGLVVSRGGGSVSSNIAIGSNALQSNTSGSNNTSLGVGSLQNITSVSDNIGIGLNSGRFLADGATALTSSTQGLYIGSGSKASANSVTNENAIGYNAVGNGSNSMTLGNTSVTNTYIMGDGNFQNGKGLILNAAGINRGGKIFNAATTDNFPIFNYYPSSGTNVGSAFYIIPKGTGFNSTNKSQVSLFNTDYVADATNYEYVGLRASGTYFTLTTDKGGAGSFRPLSITVGSNVNQLWVYTSGKVGINTASDNGTDQLQVNGSILSSQFKLSALNTAPSSSTDTGVTGEIRIVNGFIYVCVATNTWQRTALSTF